VSTRIGRAGQPLALDLEADPPAPAEDDFHRGLGLRGEPLAEPLPPEGVRHPDDESAVGLGKADQAGQLEPGGIGARRDAMAQLVEDGRPELSVVEAERRVDEKGRDRQRGRCLIVPPDWRSQGST